MKTATPQLVSAWFYPAGRSAGRIRLACGWGRSRQLWSRRRATCRPLIALFRTIDKARLALHRSLCEKLVGARLQTAKSNPDNSFRTADCGESQA